MSLMDDINAAAKLFNESKNKLSAFEAIDQTCGDCADKVKRLFTSMVGDVPSFAARHGRENMLAIFDEAILAIRMCQFLIKEGQPPKGIDLNLIELVDIGNDLRY